MSIWAFWRGRELTEHLRQTRKVKVRGVRFEIQRINLKDHMAGLSVILQMHALYKREKPKDPEKFVEDEAKLRKFMRDFLYAGVVYPKLTMKDSGEDGAIKVDDLMTDMGLAQDVCSKIIEISYPKKK